MFGERILNSKEAQDFHRRRLTTIGTISKSTDTLYQLLTLCLQAKLSPDPGFPHLAELLSISLVVQES